MELGLFTMPLHAPGANFTETLKADLDQIVKLDELVRGRRISAGNQG